jgi:hypothetical protein
MSKIRDLVEQRFGSSLPPGTTSAAPPEVDKLVRAARAAGASGKRWHDWVMSDETQDVIVAAPSFTRAEQDALERAYEEGRRERSATTGRIVWTTAPKDYDYGNDTTELEVVGEYFGKPLRKVSIEPEAYEHQTNRYASGLHGAFDKNPIEEERHYREKQAERDRERAEGEAKRQTGVSWLRTASQAELEDEDLTYEKGARYEDVRAEKRRRHEVAADEERTAGFSRLTSLIPEGGTVVDEGAYIPPPKGMSGMRPIHRHATVYYNVKLVHGWPDDVEHAKVEYGVGRGKKTVSAEHFAEMLEKGHIRAVREGDVPPQPVADRIGVERWRDIRRVNVGGKNVWVGRATFGSEDLVLDDKGKLVRARKVVDAAKALAQEPVRDEGLGAPPSMPPGTTRG